MTYPSNLSLAHYGDDTGDLCTLKISRVRGFVLAPDVEEFLKASEMETVHLFFHVVVRWSVFHSRKVG